MKLYNPFTKHPNENAGKTFTEHLVFTFVLGTRLMVTGIVFIIHGLLPFIKIPAKLNLTETGLDLLREEETRLRRIKNNEISNKETNNSR